MRRQLNLYPFVFSLLLAIVLEAPAAGQTYRSIDYPGAVGTIATGVNFNGTIVGDFCTTCKPHEKVRGYILSQGMFTEIDFPGAAFTRPLAINDDGDIVGFYKNNPNTQDLGFLLSRGSFNSIDFPGASQTHAIGIDLAGDIFGGYCSGGNACYTPGENVHGFRLSGGIFTTIDFPGAIFTELWGQDTAGQIAGRYQDVNGVFHAFLLSNGSFTSIDFPGAAETAPASTGSGSVNATGDIASTYCGAEPCVALSPSSHGFLLSGGVFTKIDFPSATLTLALGLNSLDDVVGTYADVTGVLHGYLRTPH